MQRVSIVMATYCGEKYVEEQLRSLLAQSRPADEVLIFDDGSSDRTAELVSGFIAENGLAHWHFRVNEKNLGFIENFRSLLTAATGDILFLCDQDDVWYPDKLERMLAVFDANPDAMSVNGSFDFIDGEGKLIPSVTAEGHSNHDLVFRPVEPDAAVPLSYMEVLRSNASPGCTMAVRRELRDYYLAHTSGLIPHDWELNVFAGEIGKAYFYNRPVIGYRIHGANVIGLRISDGKTHLSFQTTEDKRLRVFHEQEKLLEFYKLSVYDSHVEARDYIRHFESYLKLRRQCLIRHNPFAFFGFFAHLRYLRPNLSSRTFFGDLAYALRIQKFFERT